MFIDGEAGTTGLSIRRRLADLPVDVVTIDPAVRRDPAARRALMAAVDVVILCLPDDAAREAVRLARELGPDTPRILDASSAHRTDPGWAYGFPELDLGQADRIAYAAQVANPGCYATGAIALLRPLIDAGLLAPHTPIAINAVSGYSGGGHAMIDAYEATAPASPPPAFELYALGLDHKHIAEITLYAGLAQPPLFVPSVGRFRQGMIVSIPLHTDRLVSPADLHAALAEHYAESANIAVLPPTTDGRLDPQALNGTDRLELRVHAPSAGRQVLLTARLDNLGKGAAGAAVQNLRLMLGYADPRGD